MAYCRSLFRATKRPSGITGARVEAARHGPDQVVSRVAPPAPERLRLQAQCDVATLPCERIVENGASILIGENDGRFGTMIQDEFAKFLRRKGCVVSPFALELCDTQGFVSHPLRFLFNQVDSRHQVYEVPHLGEK
jgi:hypothetical protein